MRHRIRRRGSRTLHVGGLALSIALFVCFFAKPLAAAELQRKQIVLQKAYIPKDVFVLKTPDAARAETEEENRRLDADGPDQEIRLHGTSATLVHQLDEFGFGSIRRLLNLSTIVYADANPDSGVYYYKPRSWSLKWTEGEGYYLNFFSKPGGSDDKNILVNMTLSEGHSQRDLEILKELLKVYLRASGVSLSRDIVLRPLLANWEPQFPWTDFIDQQPELTTMSIEDGEFVMSASVDPEEKQVLIEALADSNLPLGGNVAYQHEELALSSVTASLNLADDRAYGGSPWSRAVGEPYTEFLNPHDFTIRLDHLLYLRRIGNQLRLRGFRLGGQALAPGAAARIENAKIHPEIDEAATIQAWFDYRFEPTETEMEAVLSTFRGGVGSLPETSIRIRMADTDGLFEQYGLDLVMVRVKSRFFDPDPENVEWDEKVYEFGRGDSATTDVATLFAPPDIEEPAYEYKVIVYTAHDELATDWLPPSVNNPELIFVRAGQIEEILGE